MTTAMPNRIHDMSELRDQVLGSPFRQVVDAPGDAGHPYAHPNNNICMYQQLTRQLAQHREIRQMCVENPKHPKRSGTKMNLGIAGIVVVPISTVRHKSEGSDTLASESLRDADALDAAGAYERFYVNRYSTNPALLHRPTSIYRAVDVSATIAL